MATLTLVAGIGLLVSAPSPNGPKKIPTGIVASHLAGQLLVDASSQCEMVGYYTFVQGVPNLFNGPASAASARLTFRTDKFQLSGHANGSVFLLRAIPPPVGYVALRVYYNPTPAADFSNPASFSSGQLVGTFHTKGSQTTILDTGGAVNVGSLELVSSTPFSHDGQTVDIGKALDAVTITLHARAPGLLASFANSQWPFGGSAIAAEGSVPNGPK